MRARIVFPHIFRNYGFQISNSFRPDSEYIELELFLKSRLIWVIIDRKFIDILILLPANFLKFLRVNYVIEAVFYILPNPIKIIAPK